MEKARLYHPDYPAVESSHPIRYPSVYAPLPQAPPSPSHQQDGAFQVLAIPCSRDRHPDSHSAICLSDNARDSRYSETTSNDSTAVSMGGDEYCLCSADGFCFSASGNPSSLAHLSVFPNYGQRWQLQRADYEGRIVANLSQASFQSNAAADSSLSASMTTPGYPAPCRRFPKMGQTCLRSSYASRSRGGGGGGGQHHQGVAPSWSSVDCGRPRPEGRARSDERMEDEVLVNRSARTPVGYRRIPRAESVSPRCRSKRSTCVEA